MIVNPHDKKAMRAAQLYCLDGNKHVGLTSGTFDLFHDYHLRYLERCRRLCDVFVVGVDSDSSVRKSKGPDRPILSEFQRLMLMDANKYITFCYIQDSLDDFSQIAEMLMPQRGSIFRNEEFKGRESEVARGNSKADVIIVPDVWESHSTTTLIDRINELKKFARP